MWSVVLQASQPGLNVENGRSVYGNAGLIRKRDSRAAAFSELPLRTYFVFLGNNEKKIVFSIKMYGEKNENRRHNRTICLSSYVQYCTAVLLL